MPVVVVAAVHRDDREGRRACPYGLTEKVAQSMAVEHRTVVVAAPVQHEQERQRRRQVPQRVGRDGVQAASDDDRRPRLRREEDRR